MQEERVCEKLKYYIFVYNPINSKVVYMQSYCDKDENFFLSITIMLLSVNTPLL